MKTMISAATLVVALLGANVAWASHPPTSNSYAYDTYLSPEQAEHREFQNVQRGTFPGTMERSAERHSMMVRKKPKTPRNFFSHDGTRRY